MRKGMSTNALEEQLRRLPEAYQLYIAKSFKSEGPRILKRTILAVIAKAKKEDRDALEALYDFLDFIENGEVL